MQNKEKSVVVSRDNNNVRNRCINANLQRYLIRKVRKDIKHGYRFFIFDKNEELIYRSRKKRYTAVFYLNLKNDKLVPYKNFLWQARYENVSFLFYEKKDDIIDTQCMPNIDILTLDNKCYRLYYHDAIQKRTPNSIFFNFYEQNKKVIEKILIFVLKWVQGIINNFVSKTQSWSLEIIWKIIADIFKPETISQFLLAKLESLKINKY